MNTRVKEKLLDNFKKMTMELLDFEKGRKKK